MKQRKVEKSNLFSWADDQRTHWDMLLERRSVTELEELLKERLDLIKTKRRG